MLSTNPKERSPEVELLLCCARTHVDEETECRIRELVSPPLDWGTVLQLADEHMVLPLLHRTLGAVAPEAAPSSVQDQLRAGFHANVRRNLLLAHELLNLLALFDEHNIPVVTFKGPIAAASVYGDLHVRPFGDLDLLVQLEDVPRAERLLLDRGFDDWETLPPLSALDFDPPPSWYAALTEPFSKAKNYVRASEQEVQVSVELHWELMPPYFRHPLDVQSFWERLRTVPLLDEPVRTFSSEDTLLHFSLHGTLHRWRPLRLVCDVAEFLRRHSESLDWEQLLDRAAQLHSKRLFFLALRLAHELLEAPLPAPVRHRAYRHRAVASLAKQCRRDLFHPLRGPSRIWNAYAFDLQIRDRLRDGIGLCISQTRTAFASYLQKMGTMWE